MMKITDGVSVNHDARVEMITKALNEMLKESGINLVLEPEGSDFNIYKQTTEVAYKLCESVMVVEVDELAMSSDENLECKMGEAIARHLPELMLVEAAQEIGDDV